MFDHSQTSAPTLGFLDKIKTGKRRKYTEYYYSILSTPGLSLEVVLNGLNISL
jgi:hypothetical protein